MNTQPNHIEGINDSRMELYRNMTPETLKLMIEDTLSTIAMLGETAAMKAEDCSENTRVDTGTLRNWTREESVTYNDLHSAAMRAYATSVRESIDEPETNALRQVLWEILCSNHIFRELTHIYEAAQ